METHLGFLGTIDWTPPGMVTAALLWAAPSNALPGKEFPLIPILNLPWYDSGLFPLILLFPGNRT